jgi:hypothetical protein
VLGSSGFRTVSDLDRPGVRVAGEANTTTIRAATHELKSAVILAVPSVAEAIDMLRSGRIDAFALGRDALVPYQAEIPGSRILEGHLHSSAIAIAVPKQRPAALAYVSAFLNEEEFGINPAGVRQSGPSVRDGSPGGVARRHQPAGSGAIRTRRRTCSHRSFVQ